MAEPVEKVDVDVEDQDVDTKVDDTPVLTEVEKEAASKGWKPEDKFEGDPEDWVPAKHFIKFGELKAKFSQTEREVAKRDKLIKMMKEHHVNVRETAFKQAIDQLKQQRQVALTDNDIIQAERIKDRMDDIRTNFKVDDILPKEIERELQTTVVPEYEEFLVDNPWYKAGTNDPMSLEADAIGESLYKQGKTMSQVYKGVAEKMRKLYPEKFDAPPTKVNEAGSQRSSGTSTHKLSRDQLDIAKAFDMTPAEYAKEIGQYKGR